MFNKMLYPLNLLINFFKSPPGKVVEYKHTSYWKGVYTARLDCLPYPVTIDNGKVYINDREFTPDEIYKMTPLLFSKVIPEGERHWEKWGEVIKLLTSTTLEKR